MSELGSRLRELPLPPADQARVRAARRAAALVERAPSPRPHLALPSLRPAILLALFVFVLVGFAFTPPGQAVTEKLGELVGIGEPATLPARDQGAHLTDRTQPVVIASGRAPDGTVYEIVANRSAFHPLGRDGHPDAGGGSGPLIGAVDDPVTCLTVDLPNTPALETVELCVGARERQFLAGDVLDAVNFVDRAAPGEESEFAGSEARYVLSAELSPNIEKVELSYEDRSGQRTIGYTDVGHVDEEIAQRIGTDDRVGYLVAFLPDDGLPSPESGNGGAGARREAGVLGTVRLVGFDASGEVVARNDFGSGMADFYEKRERDRVEAARLRVEIEAAQRRDGLALNRANVTLCADALRTRVDAAGCPELLREAAARGLFGLSAAGPDGEDTVLPD
jgi:hypothetical protein